MISFIALERFYYRSLHWLTKLQWKMGVKFNSNPFPQLFSSTSSQNKPALFTTESARALCFNESFNLIDKFWCENISRQFSLNPFFQRHRRRLQFISSSFAWRSITANDVIPHVWLAPSDWGEEKNGKNFHRTGTRDEGRGKSRWRKWEFYTHFNPCKLAVKMNVSFWTVSFPGKHSEK